MLATANQFPHHQKGLACQTSCTSRAVSSRTRHLRCSRAATGPSHNQCDIPAQQQAEPAPVQQPLHTQVPPSLILRRLVRHLMYRSKRMSRMQRSAWGHELAGSMAMGLVCPALSGNGFQDLLANKVLVTGFLAWFAAQFGKVFTWRFKRGVWDLRAIIQPGGMPSSHSSLCAGVTTALALQEGLSSPLFAVALAFSVIVMYDAMGVRQHAGKQAAVLNQVVTELFQKNPAIGDIKLKEILGHTPRQVLCGAVLGFVIAVLNH